MIIYHVVLPEVWATFEGRPSFRTPSLETEGFIHCSGQHQVAGVLEKYFHGKTGLVKLVIDTAKLTSNYLEEWSNSSMDTFPHIYGPINIDAVIDIIAI